MGSDVEAVIADIATGIDDVTLGLLMWQLRLLSIVGAEVLYFVDVEAGFRCVAAAH